MTTKQEYIEAHLIISTEAGSIDFGFINSVMEVPGFFHFIVQANLHEETFVLENGSKWESANVDMIENWTSNKRLIITQNQALLSTYRFALVNPILQKAVPISLVREPIPNNMEAFYILRIDPANDVVVLSDQSEWLIYSHDHGTLRKFNEHDRIILGINTSDTLDTENKKHYIIINTTTNQYVRANPIG